MRTTVTLDPDTEAALRRAMARRGVSFKRALNDAIRAGIDGGATVTTYTRARHLGEPLVDLDRALRIAAELEDEARARRIREGR